LFWLRIHRNELKIRTCLVFANNKEGDVPDFELRGEDGRAIDTQQIFSGGVI